MKEDFYTLLNVSRDASVDEIKKAYKRLALQLHPDKTTEKREEAEEKFKKVTEAYAVLSDPEKRQSYDQFGTVPDGHGPGMMPGDINDILKGMFGNMGFGDGPSGPGGPAHFSFMFGGGGNQRGGEREQDPVHVNVTLDDVLKGAKKHVEFDIKDVCTQCKGCGAQDPSDVIKCIKCNGAGTVMQAIGPFFVSAGLCPSCFGNGSSVRSGRTCTKCKGERTCCGKKSIEVKVPKGIPNNHVHVLKGHGSYNVQSKAYNDVVLFFHYVIPSSDVRIDNNGNVFIAMDVKLEELLCGFTRDIHLYDKPFSFRSEGYFNPTKKFIVPDLGLPSLQVNGRHGNLIVDFKVVYPEDVQKVARYRDVFTKVFKVSSSEQQPDTDENNDSKKENNVRVLKIG